MTHISDFDQIALSRTGTGPVVTGKVVPDGSVDWIHVWILQSQAPSYATAVGRGASSTGQWSVETELQPGPGFTQGPALALATASMTTVATDGSRSTTVAHWSRTILIE